ncbi:MULTISPECIES: IS3 family transposase [unclassified Streptosporangium]|uniref:IS3 family transposase n=1 Tax=Streptosporangium sp. NPDC049248 TaxID=3155651 RepID=UPI003435DD0A
MIREIHVEFLGSYGAPRVHAELTLGLAVNRKRVERLMRQAGLQGAYRRRGRRTPVNVATKEDLVGWAFTVQVPDRLWLTVKEACAAGTAGAKKEGLAKRPAR